MNELSLRDSFAGQVASGMEKTFLASLAWAMNDGADINQAEDLAARNVARLSYLVADALVKQRGNPDAAEIAAKPVYWRS